jgi:hypothetical protein
MKLAGNNSRPGISFTNLTTRSSRPVRLSRGLEGVKSHDKSRANRPGGLALSVRRQLMFCMNRRLQKALILLLAVCVGGCSSTQPLMKGEKLQNNSTDIRVGLFDHRTVKFRAGEYTVNPTVDSLYIEGVGTTEMTNEKAASEFRGRIGFRDIQQLEVIRPKTLPPYVGTLVIASAALIGLYFITEALKPKPQDVAGAAE